jgi:hypothetical protein
MRRLIIMSGFSSMFVGVFRERVNNYQSFSAVRRSKPCLITCPYEQLITNDCWWLLVDGCKVLDWDARRQC